MIPNIMKPLLERPRAYSTRRRINLFEDDPDVLLLPHHATQPAPRVQLPFRPDERRRKQDILPLANLLREKRGNNEVTAENARTVKAALKTSDHRDLARFHATSVRDFGDQALAEVADFRDQLHKANPRAAQSWLAAMKKELPAETDRMEKVLKQVEKEDAGAKETGLDQPRKGNSVRDVLDSMLDPEIVERLTILPQGKTAEGEWKSAIPEAGLEVLEALMLPGHVARGGSFSEKDVTDMALNVTGGGAASSVPRGALKSGVTRLRGTPKFMRKVDLERQGKEAAQEVMSKQASKPQSMFREDVGEITFDFGDPKSGLSHIVRQRIKKDGMTQDEADRFVREQVPEILANGRLRRLYKEGEGRRADIGYKGQTVSLSLRRNGDRETWVITGFVDFE